jgi:hypothetical protein
MRGPLETICSPRLVPRLANGRKCCCQPMRRGTRWRPSRLSPHRVEHLAEPLERLVGHGTARWPVSPAGPPRSARRTLDGALQDQDLILESVVAPGGNPSRCDFPTADPSQQNPTVNAHELCSFRYGNPRTMRRSVLGQRSSHSFARARRNQTSVPATPRTAPRTNVTILRLQEGAGARGRWSGTDHAARRSGRPPPRIHSVGTAVVIYPVPFADVVARLGR